MANIATLVVSLGANSAKLIKGLKLGERAARTWAAAMKKTAEKVKNFFKGIVSGGINLIKKALLGLPAAFAGISAALGIKAKDVRELQNMAQVLGVSTTALQEWQYAAQKVGIEGDKLTDIFKDTSDKIGDFVQTGGGSAADMFEQLNIKAKDFVNLSPDQALLKLAKATENLNQQDKIFFFEAIASDASHLIPLLENGGAKLEMLAEQAKKTGNVLSNDQLNGLGAFGKSFGLLLDKIKGFWNQVSAAMAPAFTLIYDKINEWIDRMGGLQPAAIQVATWIVNMASTTVQAFGKVWGMIDGMKIGLMKLRQIALDTVGTLAALADLTLPSTWFEKAGLANFADSLPETIAKAMADESVKIDAEIGKLKASQSVSDAVSAELEKLADDMKATINGGSSAEAKNTTATNGNTSATNNLTTEITKNNGNLQSLMKGINAQNDLLGKEGAGNFGAVDADRIFGTGDAQKNLKSSDSFEGFAKIAADKIASGNKSDSNLRQVSSVISTLERQIVAYSKMRGYDTKGMQAVVDKLKKDAEEMASATQQKLKAESTETIFERLKGIAESAQAGAEQLKPAVESIAQVTKDGITTTYQTTKEGVIAITNQAVKSIKAAGGSNNSADSALNNSNSNQPKDLGSLTLNMSMDGKQITSKIFADSRAAADLRSFVERATTNAARSVAA